MLKNSSVKRNISTSLMKGCNMKKTYSVAMMGVAASLLLTHGAYGSIIVPPLAGPFNTAFSSVSTPHPGVEGTGSGNTLTFVEGVTVLPPPNSNWGAFFDISNTGPNNTTEYLVTKIVKNDTGKQWSNFFILQGGGYTFDYTILPTITGSLSPQIDPGGLGFHWTGLTVPDTTSITVSFYIDVCATCSGTAVILQQATVPEPAVLVLTGGGLVSLGLWRRRRTRGRRLSV